MTRDEDEKFACKVSSGGREPQTSNKLKQTSIELHLKTKPTKQNLQPKKNDSIFNQKSLLLFICKNGIE